MSNDQVDASAETKPVKSDQPEAAADYCPIKADLFNRMLAKFIDFLIASVLWFIFQWPIGFFAAITYILIADGIPPRGQSLGKRFIGLKVVVNPIADRPRPCTWKQSMVRNIPFILVGPAAALGFFGILIFLAGLVVLAFEIYFIFADDQGIRLGDIFANSKVLDA